MILIGLAVANTNNRALIEHPRLEKSHRATNAPTSPPNLNCSEISSLMSHGPNLPLASACLTLMITSSVIADTQSANTNTTAGVLEETVVTGSRLTNVDRTTLVYELSKSDVERQAPLSVLDALQNLPGIYVSQPAGRSGIASVTSRGAESNFTVVTVDGVQVNDPTNTRGGSFDFTTIDLNEIEDIQLLQGPASSRYGSDALAGVINITTISKEPTTSLLLSIGEQNFRTAGLRSTLAAGELGRLDVAASTTTDEARSDSEYSGNFFRLNYRNSQNRLKFQSQVAFSESQQAAFPEDSGGREFAVLRALDDRNNRSATFAVNSKYPISSTSSLALSVNHLRRSDDVSSPGVAPGPRSSFGVPPNESDSEFERTQANFHLTKSWGAIDFVAGVDWRREDGEAVGEVMFLGSTFFQIDRNITGIFIEALTTLTSRTSLHISTRHDEPDDFSGESTYAVSLDHRIGDNWTIYARTSTGFKLPSFFALANPLVGNPNLQPETVRSFEVGFSGALNDSNRVQFSWFNNNFDELIDFDPIAFTNINRSEVETQGFDLSWSGNSERYSINYGLSYSYTDIDVKPSGQLRQRPQSQISGHFGVALGSSANLNITLQNADTRFDSSIPNPAVELDSYTRLDVAIHYDISANLQSSVVVDNLLDESYFDADGFPAIGRRGRIIVRYTLN